MVGHGFEIMFSLKHSHLYQSSWLVMIYTSENQRDGRGKLSDVGDCIFLWMSLLRLCKTDVTSHKISCL